MSEDTGDEQAGEPLGLPVEMAAVASVVSNWGKWGEEDELGTLNYITPDHIRRVGML